MDRIRFADRWRGLGPEFPRWATALVFALLFGLAALPALDALAEAPPLAIVPYDVHVTNAPSPDSRVVGEVPADTQIELTGRAAPGFIEIYWNGQTAWIPAADLEVSHKIGMQTAMAATDLTIVTAPNPSGDPRGTVPAGASIILVGAHVNGYAAMSYNGTGGWVPDAGLA
jgi:hypothetical protein